MNLLDRGDSENLSEYSINSGAISVKFNDETSIIPEILVERAGPGLLTPFTSQTHFLWDKDRNEFVRAEGYAGKVKGLSLDNLQEFVSSCIGLIPVYKD